MTHSLLSILPVLIQAISTPGQDTATRPGAIRLDPKAVENWADSVVKPALEKSGVPGLVIVVVQRAAVVLNKGYGVSDIVAKTPVSAESTLFQTASIGKTMTAIITTQLLEEGVLALDEDINHYLKTAHISGPKVTLRMLLGHRGGFDDDITGLLVPFDRDITTSRAELDRRLRPLVEPGYLTAYDNQGFGVIGLVLRDVTGKSIPELYRERLFDPAGMAHTAHGKPADGKARLARCYTVQGPGAIQECELWVYRDGLMGAGGVRMSGSDISHYLRLLLNGGSLDGRTVLSPKAFAELTDFSRYRFHPGMPGGAFSFVQFEEFRGFEYAHSGSVPGFSSMMKIYPDADVAIFVTFLGGQVGGFDLTVSNVFRSLRQINIRDEAKPGFHVLRELTDSFPARFIPANRPRSSEAPQPWPAPASEQLDPFLGSYVIASNHSRSFVSRLGGWVGTIHLERAGDDEVRLREVAELGDYHKVGPLVYENAKGDRLALAETPVGRAMAVGLSGGIFRRTNWIESPGWTLPVFAIALLVLLTALVQLRRKAPDRLRRLAGSSLVGLVLVFGGLLAEWQWGVNLAIGQGAIVRPLLWRLAIHVGAGLLIWRSVEFWRGRAGGGGVGRVALGHGALLSLAGVALVVVVVAWRVVGAFPPYWSW